MEVTNRFKELDLIGRVPEELRTEIYNIAHEALTKTIPKKKKCRKAKWLPEEALRKAERRSERKRRKGKKNLTMQSSKEQHGEIGRPSSMNNAKK